MVDSLVNELTPPGSPRAGQIEVGPLPDAYGQPELVRQVWENLLSNALKFTSRTAAPQIQVGFDRDSGAYFVRDNGVGFDMRHAKKLFQPFSRLHDAKDFAGTGVGLSIVETIVRRAGGRIWCESTPGKGASFSFTLPQGDGGLHHAS